MKKILIFVFIIVTVIVTVSGCSKKDNAQFDVFYGETEKWLVIGMKDNTFQFIYKGDVEDLKKNNNDGKINFHYGTSSGTTGAVQLLNDTNYYQLKFIDNFIAGLSPKSTLNGNKYINVQISYGDTKDSIDLAAYTEYKTN